MASQDRVPDAWDDDYEAVVDAKSKSGTSQPTKISRAQRKAQHQQANKQLWESAENPDMFHVVQNRGNVAPNSEFKPALKVLSRKPQPAPSPQSIDVANGVQSLNVQDDDDSEEEERKAQQKSLAERQAQAAREREEKQRKYAEVRERLFGSPDPSSDGRASPSKTQPAKERSRQRGNNRNKPEGRQNHGSQQSSSADQSPARTPASHRQLYDPNEPSARSTKPAYTVIDPRPLSSRQEMPIRNPKGPDGSGPGGFGFAPRGGKSSDA